MRLPGTRGTSLSRRRARVPLQQYERLHGGGRRLTGPRQTWAPAQGDGLHLRSGERRAAPPHRGARHHTPQTADHVNTGFVVQHLSRYRPAAGLASHPEQGGRTVRVTRDPSGKEGGPRPAQWSAGSATAGALSVTAGSVHGRHVPGRLRASGNGRECLQMKRRCRVQGAVFARPRCAS
jgi:hypothetical protein